MVVPQATIDHYRQMQRINAAGVLAARRAWSRLDLGNLSASWSERIRELSLTLTALQVRAASAGASYGAKTLAQQGLYEAPAGFVDPVGFAGFASDGRSLPGMLYAPVPHVKNLIAEGMEPSVAVSRGKDFLSMVTTTLLADTGRAAAGVDTAARRGVGYVRMLNPPSCSRCSVLAGRFYRWNAGFNRHPHCDCVHVQTTATVAARTEGLIHDPYEYFNGLSESEQNRLYTKSGAQAIRDGGDIFQVVNSRRGMKPGGLVTTEGTSRRGYFGSQSGPRLTPEAIYAKGLPRDQTLAELERYGYILPGGQNPSGSIRGGREGFGALGRGGTRVGARQAVLDARSLGVRDPASRYTMTAAELRVFDARSRWADAQKGVNPFNPRRPLTPEIAARIERDFRTYVLGY